MHWKVSDLVDRLAGESRPGLLFLDEYGHRRDYAFDEISTHSKRYAAVLRAFGVRQDESVYVCLSTTAKCVFTLLALERLGARPILDESAAVSCSTVIADRRFREKIDDSRDRFSPDARYVLIGEECDGWARLDTLAHLAALPASVDVSARDEALQQARDEAQSRLGAEPTDIVWCTLHIEDPGWFERAIAQPWLIGCTTVAHNRSFDARERLDLVRELDVTILLQRAGDYRAELALPNPALFKMPRLRRCLVLDDACDGSLQSQWAERFGVPLTFFAEV